MPTITDIAKALGITAGTVSRALRSDPRVKETTRLDVLAKAQSLGYVPHRAAQHLARGKSDTVWILLGDLEWPQERQFASACNRLLWQRGYRSLIVLHDHNEAKLKMLLQDLASGSADGAMILPTVGMKPTQLYKDLQVPLLFVDRWVKGLKFPVVTSNNFQGAKTLLRRALEQGPAFSTVITTREARNEVEQDRHRGLSEACKECGITLHYSPPSIPVGAPLAIYGNTQEDIVEGLRQGGLNQCVSILTWDQWLGSPRPAQAVYYARQDFEAMSNSATEILLAWITTNNIAHGKTETPILDILSIQRS